MTMLERLIGYFSPRWALMRARQSATLNIVRQYDAAATYGTTDWRTASNASANNETRASIMPVRFRSRDLTRNSPYANKALNVIVSNTVGAGIIPKIKGRTKSSTKQLTELWQEWAETTLCDRDNRYNFYSMQAAAMRCLVEGGEILARKVVMGGVAKLWLLEPDYINPNFSNNVDNIQGIWVDKNTTEILGYELYDYHPGDFRGFGLQSQKYPGDQVIHAYRVERVGQFRGMPWTYPVMNTIKDFEDYQNSTLIRQKVSACWTAFITEREGDPIMDHADLKEHREREASLEPATIKYLTHGQTVTMASPPAVDQYDVFSRQTLRAIAAGYGISYEALSGDYSQVNFSSGRMGHLEMQRNIDTWRWQLFIPNFCDPAFQWFLRWAQTKGADTSEVKVSWTCPAREMIDPAKEIAAAQAAIRAGLKTTPEAIREQGYDPDVLIEEQAEFNEKVDSLKLVLDSDPRYTNAQGQAQTAFAPVPEDENDDPDDDGNANNGEGDDAENNEGDDGVSKPTTNNQPAQQQDPNNGDSTNE